MTADPIREGVGHIAWVDDLAWMESMKGKAWSRFLEAEQKHWQDRIQQPRIQEKVPVFVRQIQAAEHHSKTQLFATEGNEVWIGVEGRFSYSWSWDSAKWGPSQDSGVAVDLDARSGGHLWTIEETNNGGQLYKLQYRNRETGLKRWSHAGVGPFVAVVGDRVVAVEAKKKLVYWRVVSWDAMTGSEYRVEYEEHDSSVNLELYRCSKNTAFILRQRGGFQQLLRITEKGISPVTDASGKLRTHVIGDSPGGWLQWQNGWESKGVMRAYKLPSFKHWNPQSFSLRLGLLVCHSFGERSIWSLSQNQPPRLLWRGFGTVQFDPWSGPMVCICPIATTPLWKSVRSLCELKEWGRVNTRHVQRYTVRSADGAIVPYLLVRHPSPSLVCHKKGARGLLVIAYSAYGMPTSLSTDRWTPLLESGWTLCFGMFRGGGDGSPAWAQEGRLTGRKCVLEDAFAVVKAARALTGIAANCTFLYGRSAGGLWVGGLAALFPRGNLFGGIYMEVPYLDVLRTTSNPTLPLTEVESEEFGRADQSIVDFEGMLKWSPMELLKEGGAPNLFQIVRSGDDDVSVFPYEPAKWILRSRGPVARSSSTAYFILEADQGHFSPGARGVEQNAIDAAVLDSWVEEIGAACGSGL